MGGSARRRAQIGRELRRRAPNLFECEVFRDGGAFFLVIRLSRAGGVFPYRLSSA